MDHERQSTGKPFFTINMEDLKDSSIKILESFTKKDYNLENILDSAEALKYINENNLDEIIESAKKNANRNCRDQD